MSVDAIVVGLHLRWRGVWQRPNHLLSRLARHVPVLVVEEPVRDTNDWDEMESLDGITIFRPHRTQIDDTIDARTCAAVSARLQGAHPLVWLYSAQMLALADAFPDAPVVYDKMDDLTRFESADRRIALREPHLLDRATVVFAGGRTLYDSVRDRCACAHCYPSGVEVEHFAAARSGEEHIALAGLPSPRAGYIGVIDERIDLGLLERLATARADWTFVIVGPVAKIDPASLPHRENIVYLGQRDYAELPLLLAGFDVAIMPFALNEATASISPTKTLEYLAAGLGVVSTRVADVVRDYTDIVEFGVDAHDFGAALDRARTPDATFDARVEPRLRAGAWDAIADAMWSDVTRALDERGSRKHAHAG